MSAASAIEELYSTTREILRSTPNAGSRSDQKGVEKGT